MNAKGYFIVHLIWAGLETEMPWFIHPEIRIMSLYMGMKAFAI